MGQSILPKRRSPLLSHVSAPTANTKLTKLATEHAKQQVFIKRTTAPV